MTLKDQLQNLVHHHKDSTSTDQESNPAATTMASAAQPLLRKVALVTGGSKGIGRATCLALAQAGASVAVNYSSDSSAADSLVKQIGERAVAVKADAGSVAGTQEMVRQTVAKFGKLDIVVANAGILPMKDVASTSEADFDAAFNLNVKGPYFLVQAAAPHLESGSHIILLSTTQCTASGVTPPYTLYCATKGAIEQMTRTFSKDLARKGISVNAVAPGPTGTDLFYKGKSEQVLNMIAGMNPHNRIGEPEEVADAILYLSEEGSRWITGQVLRVNGGMA